MAGPVIPTGYESLQNQVALKRRLADSMLGASTNYNHGSYTQVLADLAKAWGGKHLEKQATEAETNLNNRKLQDFQDYNKKVGAIDPNTLSPESLSGITNSPFAASNPLVEALIDTYKAKQKQAGELVKNGGRWDLKGNITPGSQVANDPNNSVIHDANGNWIPNTVKINSSLASQGFGMPNMPPTQDPGMGGQMPQQVAPQPQPQTANIPQGNPLQGAPNSKVIQGPNGPMQAWFVNGEWYDNPEGR